MKIPTTTLLLCLALSFAQAQAIAPDFTVTTTDGVQRQLYNDYLNQGKAVVMYLFFTTCPFCNQMAPFLEPFYQEWGGGDGPVEFLMLSILTTDDNLDVDRYIGLKDFTFPGAGSDGGAREAIEPYTNGTFGPYLGTPVFIVIAPDSTVQYDVRGSSYPETIDSLDAALRSIIAKPALPFQITGEVKNPNGVSMANVRPSIRNVDTDIITTDTSGKFDFVAPLVSRDAYTARFTKTEEIATNGISTYDIVRVQRHLLGIQPFESPYEYLAADVDRSGSVSIADIIHLRKLVLSIESSLPTFQPWLFINGNYTFSNQIDPFSEVYSGNATSFPIDAQGAIPPISVIAIKVGDLDFNAK